MKTILNLRKYLAVFLVLASVFVASKDASAQAYAGTVSNYISTSFNSSFVSIVNDGYSTYLGNGAYPYYSYPYYYMTTSLPFSFNYDSVQYSPGSTIYLHDNSAISFTYSGNYDYGFCISNGYQTAFPNYMNPWGLMYYPYGYSQGIYSEVTGNAPNRVWTLEFPYVYTYYSGTAVSIQIKLYETTNAVEYWYSGNNQNMQYGYVGDIGLNGAKNGDYIGYNTNYNYFSYQSYIYTPSTQLRYVPKQITSIELSAQPKLLAFGQVIAGTTSTPLCMSVKNVGQFGTMKINNAFITGGSDFSIVSSPATTSFNPGDPAGQYCVVFKPSTFGTRTATLSIATNGQDSGLQTIALTGFGTVADYTVDSTIRFKKTRTQMGTSLTQYIHITAIDQNPLFFSSFVLSGQDGGQYSVTHTPPNPMLPGQTDSIGITYTPTLEGKHVATLTVSSNAFTYPTLTVSLQGTAILPHVVVTPPVVLFDSTKEGQTVCKNISIWNPGSDTLKLSINALTSNDGDFHYTGLTGSDMNIPPDQTKTVNVCFTPLQQGSRQARLLLKTNIIKTFDTPRLDTAGTITVDIRGTGVPFGVFANSTSGSAFTDSALVGQSVCRIDTLKNNGDADIMVTGLALSGTSAADFKITGLPAFPFILKARTSMTYTICGTPDQQGLLSATGTLSGTTGGSTITSTIPLNIYGFKACIAALPDKLFNGVVLPNDGSDSTLCVTITNCGDIDAVYNATISGAAKGDYSVSPAASGTVTAKTGTTTFCVKYKPSIVGPSVASLDISAGDGSTSVSVPLQGSDGCAIVTPTADAVPATAVSLTSTFNVTINNTGSFEWTSNAGQVNPPGVFSIINTDQPTAPAGTGAIVVHMQFAPTTIGNASAILTFPSAGPCENAPINVTLNGVGVANSVSDASQNEGFTLDQSYPNPTQGNASFTYSTPREAEVRIALVDLTGKLIRTLISGKVSEGQHVVSFDARELASGTYVYMLESGSTKLVRQFILTK